MRSHSRLRIAGRAVSVLLLVLASCFATGRESFAAPPPVPGVRERLELAAEGAQLAPWQRDLMLSLSRPAGVSPGSSATGEQPTGAQTVRVDPADGTWSSMLPPPRAGSGMIYDPVRDRMIVFGGSYTPNDEVWTLGLAGTPTWTVLPASGTPPPAPLKDHIAIYDPVRDRMVLFGGWGRVGYSGEVWALSLSDAPAWTHLSPDGTAPEARSRHSAIYDPVRDRMIVFGGLHAVTPGVSNTMNDTWALSLAGTPAWTNLSPTGTPPAPRCNQSAVYDPVRDGMIVYGGWDGVSPTIGYFGEVWRLSLAGAPEWIQLSPAGTAPVARGGHTAIYDPVRDRMVLFAGVSVGEVELSDVWSLSLTGTQAWTLLIPNSSEPVPTSGYGSFYDPARDRMVAYGGYAAYGYDGYYGIFPGHGDTWALSLAGTPSWSAVIAASPVMGMRVSAEMLYDPPGDRAIVYVSSVMQTWSLTLSGAPGWSLLTGGPDERDATSAIYDPVRERMIVFGGHNPQTLPNDYVFSLALSGAPAWTLLTPAPGPSPGMRFGHSAIYDPVRDRMLVFGGFGPAYSPSNEVWSLSLSDPPTWTLLSPAGAPPSPRVNHSAIYDPVRDRMLVVGGSNGQLLADVWSLSLSGSPEWTQLAPAGSPPGPQSGGSAIYDPVRDRMVIYHGLTWALSLSDTPTWTALAPTGAPPISGGTYHGATYDPARDRMVVFDAPADANVYWLGFVRPGAAGVQPPPACAALRPASPNPFRASTTLGFSLARAGRVQLGVYDIGGRRVRRLLDAERGAVASSVTWDGAGDDGSRLGPGVYLARLTAPGVRATRRIVLLR